MKKIYTLPATLLLVVNLLYLNSSAQILPVGQSSAKTPFPLCIGCNVNNATNASDSDINSYSTLQLPLGLLTFVSQTLSFPNGSGTTGSYFNLVIEDPNNGLLDISLLGGLSLSTSNGGTPNNDTWNHTNILSLGLLSGSTTKYVISIQMPYAFDQVQIRLSGLLALAQTLRVYYAAITPNPLPLRFLSFTAANTSLGAKLSWSMEDQRDGVNIVEKSQDGIVFNEIAKINVSSQSKNFEYTDKEKNYTQTYYRIKYLHDNSELNSEVIYVPATAQSLTIYPNPCSNSFKILKGTAIEEEINVCITNLEGKVVYASTITFSDYYELAEINYLENGIYNLKMTSSSESYNTMLIKK